MLTHIPVAYIFLVADMVNDCALPDMVFFCVADMVQTGPTTPPVAYLEPCRRAYVRLAGRL